MKDNVLNQNITETLEQNYMPYAMSVIVSRAIPEIDGFKPSHRKLLYTMYKMKLLSGNKTKSANVVGQTMKLNPHGDQAIYATLVRLTRGHDALIHPFIDSKGNFGKTTSRDMAFAASRYTEVKLDKISAELFKDIEKNTVPFMDNYDGSMKEPVLLPTTYPNVIVNPNKGIAVGMASNICGFNLEEICNATIAYIKDQNVDMMEHIKAPDLSTGGRLIYSEKDIRKIYDTGLGGFKVRAKYQYVKENNAIEITEIPYTTTVEQIIDKVIELVKSGKIKEISDVRDETDLKGLRITLDLKRGTDVEKLMLRLFKATSLEDSFSCNFNILVGTEPRVMGIKEILDEWIKFRITCLKNRMIYDINEKSKRLHLLKGLEKVLLDIDKAVIIIRKTENDKLVVPNLMKAFEIDEIQAEYVADIRLRNINKEYILNRIADITKLTKDIDNLNDTLKSDKKIKKIISDDLKKVRDTYKTPRRTEIIYEEEVKLVDEVCFVEDYNLKLIFTNHNYIKKISLVSLRASNNQKIKEDDYIAQEVDSTNMSDILFFSNKHNVYKIKAHEIIDHKASNLGTYLPNILEMESDEKIIYIVSTVEYRGYMIYAFENGKLAKVPLMSYETKTKRKKLVKAYSDFSSLIKLHYIEEDVDCVMYRLNEPDDERAILFNTSLVNEKTTRNTRGVQVVRMKKGSLMPKFELHDESDLKNVEMYRSTSIPGAGTTLDIVDRLTISSHTEVI